MESPPQNGQPDPVFFLIQGEYQNTSTLTIALASNFDYESVLKMNRLVK